MPETITAPSPRPVATVRARATDALTTGAFWVLVAATAVGAVVGGPVRDRLAVPAVLQTWSTVFVSIALQSLPFLLLGVALSAAVTVALPVERLLARLPRRPAAAVPVAGVAGLVLPGCECASVPVTAGLIGRGVPPAVALTFLLSSPAINPVVLVSTAVAFPGRPDIVLARFVASLLAAVVVGLLWARFGRADLLSVPRRPPPPAGGAGWSDLVEVMRADLVRAGGFVVLGAALAACVNVLVPASVLRSLAGHEWAAVVALAVLAVVVAICSEADAFVAASFTHFSTTARLAFMVVGPMVDVKLVSLQAGTFGARFAARFAPTTFVVALGAATVVGLGWWGR